MVPIAKNNGVFDLLFLGNLGKDGEEGIIKKISQMQNTQILLPNKYDKIQESEKIDQYIKENLNSVGTIQDFNIYETK